MRGGTSHGSGAAHGAPRPDLTSVIANARVLGGHHEVALLGEQEAARVGHAVDRRDRRLGDVDVAPELRAGSPAAAPRSAASAISLRSPPAQNALSPAPVSTSTGAPSSALNRRTPSNSPARTAAFSALRASGRSMSATRRHCTTS